jgi:hypothetical protein
MWGRTGISVSPDHRRSDDFPPCLKVLLNERAQLQCEREWQRREAKLRREHEAATTKLRSEAGVIDAPCWRLPELACLCVCVVDPHGATITPFFLAGRSLSGPSRRS